MSSAGKVLIRPRGDYDATATYMVLDLVNYNRKVYIAKQTTTGNLPTNTTYWQLFAENVEDMDDLEDVNFTNPTDGQVPLYNGTTHKWENSDPPSSGHKIENASGTEMTQRDVLQFDGYLNTTDDSTNGKTIIDDSPEEVTWAVWQTMTAAQKAGKKWLITGVPGGSDPVRASDVTYGSTNVETELNRINSDLSALTDAIDVSTVPNGFKLFYFTRGVSPDSAGAIIFLTPNGNPAIASNTNYVHAVCNYSESGGVGKYVVISEPFLNAGGMWRAYVRNTGGDAITSSITIGYLILTNDY